ncbi:MAG: hypothetical protein Q9204_000766 [Flavoplaca sp. TL-2023a]
MSLEVMDGSDLPPPKTNKQFDGSQTKDYMIPGAIFEPIIKDVVGLVEHQIKLTIYAGSVVNAVLLVGGFGEDGYLHKRLQSALTGREIEVHKPANRIVF